MPALLGWPAEIDGENELLLLGHQVQHDGGVGVEHHRPFRVAHLAHGLDRLDLGTDGLDQALDLLMQCHPAPPVRL
jgi:hypothetical protein